MHRWMTIPNFTSARNKGDVCPYCRARKNIKKADAIEDCGNISMQCECGFCYARWTEYFTLIDFTIMHRGDINATPERSAI